MLDIEANRFLHHMVRFLVGTMLDVASGRRPTADFAALLTAPQNDDASAPAPASGLSLDRVQAESEAAYELLCLLAWLAPVSTPPACSSPIWTATAIWICSSTRLGVAPQFF